MAAPNGFTIATSIPPKLVRLDRGRDIGAEYQHLCIRSWIDCGFRIISVNPEDEIGHLAARHPEIEFVPVARDARILARRKLPFIADMLRALLATEATSLGIVNADLIFEPGRLWGETLPGLIANCVIGAHRYDLSPLHGAAPRKYLGGIDCFLFERSIAEKLADKAGSFAMGLPWWDCWFPAAASLMGYDFRLLERPAIAHLVHPQAYEAGMYRQFSYEFAAYVINETDKHPDPESTGVLEIVPGCRSLLLQRDASPDAEQKVPDDLAKAMEDWYETRLKRLQIRENIARPAALPAQGLFAPSSIFDRFEERAGASHALHMSLHLEQSSDLAGAQRVLAAALQHCPDDFEILTGYGDFLFRRGNATGALALLQRACELQPDSARMLNSMGVAFAALGRRDEAIACFQRIVKAGAPSLDVYGNLAVVLQQAARTREAIECLNEGLRRWPEDAQLKQLRATLAQMQRGGYAASPR